MAEDVFSFSLDHADFDEMAAGTVRATKKATMYALRATGRYVQRSAKSVMAPHDYHGTDPRPVPGDLRKAIKNAKKMAEAGDTYELKVGPWGSKKQGTQVSRYGSGGGSMMYRIAQGKLYMQSGGKAGTQYSRKAGTSSAGQIRGVPLYRGQMEELYGYMGTGTAAAEAGSKAIFESAYEKAWAKWIAK
jgi:hypothetical protein